MSNAFSCSIRWWAVSLALLFVVAAPADGAAEEADEPRTNPEESSDTDAADLDTVVVTAVRRDTALQDADVAATVLNWKTLKEARVTDIRRIDDLVPNVQFNDSGQIGAVYIGIRGVESNPFIVNRAAVYVDGIPFRELNNSVLPQLEAVEVLRGPQSTLYGANTESGLILLRTREPTETFQADGQVTATSFDNGESYRASGFIGGSLVPNSLTGGLSVRYADADYFVRNIGNTPQGPGRFEERLVQSRLRWTPTDRVTINATAYHIDTSAPGVYRFDGYPVDLERYNAVYRDGQLFDPANPFSPPPVNAPLEAGPFTFINDAPKRAEVEELVAGTSAIFASAAGEATLAFSYRSEDIDDRGFDIDNSNGPFLAGAQIDDKEVWTGEARFVSREDRPLTYVVGASVYSENERETLLSLVGPGTLDDFAAAPEQSVDSRDWGVFGSVSYTPASVNKLTATVGLRYDRAERTTAQQAGVLDLGFDQFIFNDVALQETFDVVLPRFALRYESSDDLTFYANAAKGYIPGGFNITAAQEGLIDDAIRYGQEELWSYDAGFRWRSADRRVRLAAAAFLIQADGWQEITALEDEQGNVVSTSLITSLAAIENRGLELEGRYEPVDGLTFVGNVGFVDAEYTDFAGRGAELVIGNPVKLIPEYDANLAVRYQLPSGWFVRGEANLLGDTPLDEGRRQGFDADALAVQEAVAILGLQVGYDAFPFSARLFVENLTDQRRISGAAFPNAFFPADGVLYAAVDAPRVFGVELSMSW